MSIFRSKFNVHKGCDLEGANVGQSFLSIYYLSKFNRNAVFVSEGLRWKIVLWQKDLYPLCFPPHVTPNLGPLYLQLCSLRAMPKGAAQLSLWLVTLSSFPLVYS